jgi:DnaK suppressor protein
MDERATERFRERLLEMRQALAGEVVTLREESSSLGTDGIQDAADDAANTYARQLLLNLSEREREALRGIDEALDRLEDGSFGVCQECGEEIGEARLEVLPYATLCVECKSNQESGIG